MDLTFGSNLDVPDGSSQEVSKSIISHDVLSRLVKDARCYKDLYQQERQKSKSLQLHVNFLQSEIHSLLSEQSNMTRAISRLQTMLSDWVETVMDEEMLSDDDSASEDDNGEEELFTNISHHVPLDENEDLARARPIRKRAASELSVVSDDSS